MTIFGKGVGHREFLLKFFFVLLFLVYHASDDVPTL